MVDPGRELLAGLVAVLAGLVAVDETSLPFRAKDGPVRAKPARAVARGQAAPRRRGRDQGQGPG
jgi:hypothetical protein